MHPEAWEKQMEGVMVSALDGHYVRITIGDKEMWVEAAATHESRVAGLADREKLPYDGMIFVYQGDHTAPYSFADMAFDISIYFFDADGKMVWWSDSSNRLEVQSEVPYRFVVEADAGLELEGELELHEVRAEVPGGDTILAMRKAVRQGGLTSDEPQVTVHQVVTFNDAELSFPDETSE